MARAMLCLMVGFLSCFRILDFFGRKNGSAPNGSAFVRLDPFTSGGPDASPSANDAPCAPHLQHEIGSLIATTVASSPPSPISRRAHANPTRGKALARGIHWPDG